MNKVKRGLPLFPKAAPVPSSVLSGQRQHKKTRIDIIQAGIYDSKDKVIHPARPPPVQLPYPRYVQIIDLSCPSVKKKCSAGRENMRENPIRRLDIPLEIGYHWKASHSFAAVVESADTRDLKSLAGNGVRVQVPPAAPNQSANFDTKTALRFGGLFLHLCPETVYSCAFRAFSVFAVGGIAVHKNPLAAWPSVGNAQKVPNLNPSLYK